MSNRFFKIPGYSRYKISRDGVVKSLNFGILLYGSRNPAGYVNLRISPDGKRASTVGRHVLMAYAFKHPGKPTDGLIVNHKNGIKGDDRPDNLEFITPKENCEHAGLMGLSEKCKPCETFNIESGERETYPSFIELAKKLGISKDVASFRCKSNGKIAYNGYCFRELSSEPWPKYGVNGILVKCLITDEITHYPTARLAARDLGMPEIWFTRKLKLKAQVITPNFKLVKPSASSEAWREVKDPIIAHQETGANRALIGVNRDGNVSLFLSSIELARFLSYPKSNICYWAKSKNKKFIKGLKIYYYNSETLSSLNLSNCGKALLKDYLLQRNWKR